MADGGVTLNLDSFWALRAPPGLRAAPAHITLTAPPKKAVPKRPVMAARRRLGALRQHLVAGG
eukprot:COSAG06_NODE_33288_length_492_cov_0.984733_1_plen_62_part_10